MCILNRKRKKEKVCRAPAAAFETLASHWKIFNKGVLQLSASDEQVPVHVHSAINSVLITSQAEHTPLRAAPAVRPSRSPSGSRATCAGSWASERPGRGP